MSKISIVVPIYNVENYLPRCIESLIRQTYQNLEIILVNDGSTDSCLSICNYYSKKDKRIVVVDKTNGGLSDARNAGIEIAHGNYITFVDSDDYVSEHYVSHLYEAIVSANADISIVKCNTFYEDTEKSFTLSDQLGSIETISSEEAILRTLDIVLRQSAWGKLYPISLFKNIRFPVGALYEDLAIVFYLMCKCSTIAIADNYDYYYLIRKNSIMTSSFSIRQFYSLGAIYIELNELEKTHPHLHDKIVARKLYEQLFVYYRFKKSGNNKTFKNEFNILKKDIYQNIESIQSYKNIKPSIAFRIKAYRIGWLFFSMVYSISNKAIDRKNKK